MPPQEFYDFFVANVASVEDPIHVRNWRKFFKEMLPEVITDEEEFHTLIESHVKNLLETFDANKATYGINSFRMLFREGHYCNFLSEDDLNKQLLHGARDAIKTRKVFDYEIEANTANDHVMPVFRIESALEVLLDQGLFGELLESGKSFHEENERNKDLLFHFRVAREAYKMILNHCPKNEEMHSIRLDAAKCLLDQFPWLMSFKDFPGDKIAQAPHGESMRNYAEHQEVFALLRAAVDEGLIADPVVK